MTRTDNSLKNVKFTLFFQIAALIVAFFTRKVFVTVLTKDYLGLTGTFADILSVLSLAELGVGTAVIYSLYKPLAEGNEEQLSAIMALHRRIYRIIGLAVAVTGASLTPFLPYLIHDLPSIPFLNLIYLLFVLNSALAYFYTYKQSLIVADQRQYVVTGWQSGLDMAMYAAQALFLLLSRSYFVYLGIQIGTTLLKNVMLARYADRHYPYLRTKHPALLDANIRQEISRNVKALSLHNLGGVAVFGTDNLLIVYFLGLGTVGVYSNYLMTVNAVRTLYDYLLRSVTASVGNFCVSEGPDAVLPVFWRIQFFVSWLIGFSTVCFAVLLNPFVELWVGRNYLFNQEITLIIALNFYVWGMRKAILMFWNAYGLYWHGRFKPVAECAVNLGVSILLAPWFGVAGILTGTVVSTMLTCFWVEPTVLFRRSFKATSSGFFKQYIVNTGVTVAAFFLTWWLCSLLPSGDWGWFVVKTIVAVVLSNAVFLAFYFRRPEFWYFVDLLRARLAMKGSGSA